MSSNRFKLILVGNGGTGKSSFLNRHLTGNFSENYVPTLGVDVHPLTFRTNYGDVTFDCWDTAGVEKFGGLREGYYVGADALLLFFDVTCQDSLDKLEDWHRLVKEVVCTNLPTIVCGNKVDMKKNVSNDWTRVAFSKAHPNVPYLDLSAKSCYNFEKPFLLLARALTGHQDLAFLAKDPSIEERLERLERIVDSLVIEQNHKDLIRSIKEKVSVYSPDEYD